MLIKLDSLFTAGLYRMIYYEIKNGRYQIAAKTTAKKTVPKKSPAKKVVAKKAPANKVVAKKEPAKKASAKKAVAKKVPAKKVVAKKAPAKKDDAKKVTKKKVSTNVFNSMVNEAAYFGAQNDDNQKASTEYWLEALAAISAKFEVK